MRPPTEAEDEMAPQPSENPAPGEYSTSYMTEDKEVAEWVHKQLKLLESGQLKVAEKPALHAVALDKVATSPIHDDPKTPVQAD
jgi:mitogen-activated protein kinase kinase